MSTNSEKTSLKLKHKPDFTSEVCERIRALRERLGYTQAELASLLADPKTGRPLSQAAVKNYEARNVPEAHVLLQIARLGDSTVDWLLTGASAHPISDRQIAALRSFWKDELPQSVKATAEQLGVSIRFMRKITEELLSAFDNIPMDPKEVIDAAERDIKIAAVKRKRKGKTQAGNIIALSQSRTKNRDKRDRDPS